MSDEFMEEIEKYIEKIRFKKKQYKMKYLNLKEDYVEIERDNNIFKEDVKHMKVNLK